MSSVDNTTLNSTDVDAHDVPTEFNPSASFQVNEGPRDIALIFIGDAYVAGYGDPKGSGWVSRVVGRTSAPRARAGAIWRAAEWPVTRPVKKLRTLVPSVRTR